MIRVSTGAGGPTEQGVLTAVLRFAIGWRHNVIVSGLKKAETLGGRMSLSCRAAAAHNERTTCNYGSYGGHSISARRPKKTNSSSNFGRVCIPARRHPHLPAFGIFERCSKCMGQATQYHLYPNKMAPNSRLAAHLVHEHAEEGGAETVRNSLL